VFVERSWQWKRSWKVLVSRAACFLSISVRTTGAVDFKALASMAESLTLEEREAASLEVLIWLIMLE